MAVLTQVLGGLAIVAGTLMIYVPVGIILAGIFLIVLGYLLEAARATEANDGSAQSDASATNSDTARHTSTGTRTVA